MLEQMLAFEPLPDAKYQAEVEALGKKMGLHALMNAAAYAWSRRETSLGTNRCVGPTRNQAMDLLASLKSS